MTPKEECEVLMNELFPIASTFLNKNGEFYPFGSVLKQDGLVEQVAFYDGNEFPKSEDVIKNLTNVFYQRALDKEIKASGIVWEAKVLCPDNTKSNAIVISLEHSNDYSVTVVYPYKKNFFGKIKWRTMFAAEGDRNIFK